MPQCLLGIGANLGDPPAQIRAALRSLAAHPRIQLGAVSRPWVTEPVGGPRDQPRYVNAAAVVETDLSPQSLLEVLHAVENQLGRIRLTPWSARPIDLDILLYDDLVVRDRGLCIPHRAMVARQFVLGPAAEIAPQWQHPELHWSLDRLWQHLISAAPRFALVGCPGGIADQVATVAGAKLIADPVMPLAEATGSSVGPAVENSLKLLQARVARLHRSGWNEPVVAQPLVSSFWVDEALVRAKWLLPKPDFRQFEHTYRQMASSTAPAKLVIVASGLMRAQFGTLAGQSYRRYLRDLTRQGVDRGTSVMELETPALVDVVREAAGALVASQSPGSFERTSDDLRPVDDTDPGRP